MDTTGNYAGVKVESETGRVIVPISFNKPDVPVKVQEKWQKIVDLIARIMKVPTGIITRLTTENLEIFVASKTAGNPYKKDDKDSLGIGMFCETVAGKRKKLVVQDTAESEYWLHNPHAKLGMHSYCGVPIEWEDGELFGTFCMLTDKTNRFSDEFQELMLQFKEVIETDLSCILLNEELKKRLSSKELQLRETHHRIKNHFNLLISLINLQSMHKTENIHEVLTDLQNRIRAISLIHERLHMGQGVGTFPLHEYIPQLCRLIISDFLQYAVDLRFEIDDIILPLDRTVTIGLIIAELTGNSIKHAFRKTPSPAIGITIQGMPDNMIEIVYKDNGSGYPAGFDSGKSDSIGMLLIRTLTEQLQGTIRLGDSGGAEYRTVFKASDP